MGSCFPGSTSLLGSPVVCKYSLRYLVFVKFLYCIKKHLLAGVFALLRPFGYANLQYNVLIQILSHGDQNFPNELNKNILLLTLQFIHKSGRFD